MAWSPDSSQIAFVHKERDSQSIYILHLEDESVTLVKEIEWSGFSSISLTWSPDGAYLATMIPGIDIVVLDLTGEVVAQLDGELSDAIMRVSLYDYNAVWSSDSKFLAWESKKDGITAHVVFVGDVETQEITTIIQDAETPIWSPDGTWLAFAPYPLGGLEAIKLDGSSHVALLEDDFYQAAWSPDGKIIVFDQDTLDPTQHIYTIDVMDLP